MTVTVELCLQTKMKVGMKRHKFCKSSAFDMETKISRGLIILFPVYLYSRQYSVSWKERTAALNAFQLPPYLPLQTIPLCNSDGAADMAAGEKLVPLCIRHVH